MHGTQDVVCPMGMVQALSEEMDNAGNDATIVLYTGTHHAFYNPEAGTDPTARLVYSATAEARSRDMIDEFLAQTLTSAAVPVDHATSPKGSDDRWIRGQRAFESLLSEGIRRTTSALRWSTSRACRGFAPSLTRRAR